MQKILDETLEEISGEGFRNYGIKDALEILEAKEDSIQSYMSALGFRRMKSLRLKRHLIFLIQRILVLLILKSSRLQ